MTKPFSMRELLARVKANIRRTAMLSSEPEMAVDKASGLVVNTETYQVTKNGKTIDLTQREYELLAFLASHPGMVFTREQLLEQVWGYDYFGDSRTVDVHVKRLREKLTDSEQMGWLIKTVWGVGYKFEVK